MLKMILETFINWIRKLVDSDNYTLVAYHDVS